MKTTIIFAIACIVLMSSCSEKIDLTLNNAASKIVIEGSLTSETKQHEVRVSRSLGYLDANATPAVTDAQVTISDGSQIFVLTHKGNGVYVTGPGVSGIPGRTYTIRVVADGQEFTASERMNPVTPIDSLAVLKAYMAIQPGVVWEPGKQYYNIGVYCQEPGNETNFYMFDVYVNNRLWTDTITKRFFSDDGFINGSYIQGMNVLQIDAAPGDSVRLVMSSVSKDFYYFMYGVIQSGMSGNPFAGQPANLPSNLSNGALGYFRVSAVAEGVGIVPGQ